MVERKENPQRKSADVKVDTGEKQQRDSNSIGVFLPKEEKGMAGLLGVKHPQQNILEFSLCWDVVKATSNEGATDGAMLCKSYQF